MVPAEVLCPVDGSCIHCLQQNMGKLSGSDPPLQAQAAMFLSHKGASLSALAAAWTHIQTDTWMVLDTVTQPLT